MKIACVRQNLSNTVDREPRGARLMTKGTLTSHGGASRVGRALTEPREPDAAVGGWFAAETQITCADFGSHRGRCADERAEIRVKLNFNSSI